MNFYKKLVSCMFVTLMLLTNTALASEPVKSGTVVIDETQISLILGGDMGGGVVVMGEESRSFKTTGIKLGGIGIHKLHLIGNVYDMKNIEDFGGIYAAFQLGATLGYASKNSIWLKNDKGVKLNLKSSGAEGVALAIGVEGLDIIMK
ncbi:MAG: hypothetical protein GQ546_05805 [Gammaproteobacteria bacterium]|nr:hypothetical protein [Gammaproteobacteria bacterium]